MKLKKKWAVIGMILGGILCTSMLIVNFTNRAASPATSAPPFQAPWEMDSAGK